MYIIDCSGGVAGDMLLGAFLDQRDVDIPGTLALLEASAGVMAPTSIKTSVVDVLGFRARMVQVTFERPHHHILGLELRDHLNRACDLIGLGLGKAFALGCLDDILHAECRVHNEPLEHIHLHETGTPDTIVDLCGVGFFYERMSLGGEAVKATPISVGGGKVRISHGLVDVPAPATRLLLEGLCFNAGPVQSELATPTGTALVRNLAKGFIEKMPEDAETLGSATGTKRFTEAGFQNVLRLCRSA
jgi:hypothetical protein